MALTLVRTPEFVQHGLNIVYEGKYPVAIFKPLVCWDLQNTASKRPRATS
jgi:hypothetical protein